MFLTIHECQANALSYSRGMPISETRDRVAIHGGCKTKSQMCLVLQVDGRSRPITFVASTEGSLDIDKMAAASLDDAVSKIEPIG